MSNWSSWDSIQEAVGETVLVKFRIHDLIHIEDATIYDDGDGPYYVLFDGDSFNVTVEPVGWMRIPE